MGGATKTPNPYYKYYVNKNNEADLPVELQSTPKMVTKKTASNRHFVRHKDDLVDMGLIEAKSHFRVDPSHKFKVELKAEGKLKGSIGTPLITALWVKPTEELCRIIFEPGYWETVRAKYAYVPTKKKPRGMHAKGILVEVSKPTRLQVLRAIASATRFHSRASLMLFASRSLRRASGKPRCQDDRSGLPPRHQSMPPTHADDAATPACSASLSVRLAPLWYC